MSHEPLYALARARQTDLQRQAARRRKPPRRLDQPEQRRVLVVERVQPLAAIRLDDPDAEAAIEAWLRRLRDDEELRVRLEAADDPPRPLTKATATACNITEGN